MSFENEVVATEAPVAEESATSDAASSSLGVTVETKIYRTYGVLDEKGLPSAVKKDKEGKIKELENPIISQQTADGKAWKKFEEDGNTVLTENSYKFYTIETIDGFFELITDDTQRKYIINRGLQSVQTAKANQMQSEFDESVKTFSYIDQTLDLREELNTPPKRSKQSELQKLANNVSALSAEDAQKLMAVLMEQFASKGIALG